ncbi:BQ5605_C001g00785 [Microbotryum silenes-dioicae]|uniref:BQ5605_C001g00785 protein n=1 Tax=Microbotryum silenes-dioicae TaxID=796604 RepID=A0A2X0P6W2_9BASI|nr:BQ5605_C001g00785 [Microbotryum silenes-dioicae]
MASSTPLASAPPFTLIASTSALQIPPLSTPSMSSQSGPSSVPGTIVPTIGEDRPLKQAPPLYTYLKQVRLPHGHSLPASESTSAQVLRMTLHPHRCEIALVDLHYHTEEERTRHAVPTRVWFDASWIQELNLDIEHLVDEDGDPVEGSEVVISFKLHFQDGETIWIHCQVDTRTTMRHEWHYFETRIKRRLKRWSDNVPFPATISPRGAWAIPPPGTSLYSITPPPWYDPDDMRTWTYSFPPLDSDEWQMFLKKKGNVEQAAGVRSAPSPRKQRAPPVRPDALVLPKRKINKRKYSSKREGKAVAKRLPDDDSDKDDADADDLYVDSTASKKSKLSASLFEVVVQARLVPTTTSTSSIQGRRKPVSTSSSSRSASNDNAADAESERSRTPASRGRPPPASTFDPDSFAFISNGHRRSDRTSRNSPNLAKDYSHEMQLAEMVQRVEQAEERNAQLEREVEELKASLQAKDLELARGPGIAANKEGQHTLELEALTVVVDAGARREADLERNLRQLKELVKEKDLELERCRKEIEMHVLKWEKRDGEMNVVEEKESNVLDKRLDSLVVLGSSTATGSSDPGLADLMKVRDEIDEKPQQARAE